MVCEPQDAADLFQRAKTVKAIIFDVDGVFTDGRIIYNSEKEETKFFDAHDGFGIKLAQFAGLITGIISARESNAIRHRAGELKIETLYLGSFDKLSAYESLKKELKLDDNQICFIGDDWPDIPVLEKAGLPVAVHNAARLVKQTARFKTTRSGGRGAVRETVEFVLHSQNRLHKIQRKMLKAL